MRLSKCEITLSRARRLLSAFTTYHGACLMSVWSIMVSLALEYSTHLEREARSMGLSFQRRVGSWLRCRNRRSCSSGLMENQYLINVMPE